MRLSESAEDMMSMSSSNSGPGPKKRKRLSETSLKATPIFLPPMGGVQVTTATSGPPEKDVLEGTPICMPSETEPKQSVTLPPIEQNNSVTDSRHRCPHHPKVVVSKGEKPCMLTEYAMRYTAKQADVVHNFKPNQEPQRGAGQMAKDTTNRLDYKPHRVEKRYQRVPDVYQKPEGRMEDLSSYKHEYIKKDLPITKAFKPDYSRKVAGDFQGTPTYKADYRRWTPQPPDRVQKDSGYRPPTAPFVGTTGYTADYQPKRVPVRASMRPVQAVNDSDQPFGGDTSYKVDYPKKPMPPREMKEKAIYVANKAPLDGLTSYTNDFIAKQAVKLPSCKPDGGHYQSDAAFHDETTQRNDFKKWPMEKPFVREAEGYSKPDGKMEDMTTTHLDYNKKPLAPQPPAKPIDRKAVPGQFFSDTTQKIDFKRWSPIPNNRVKHSVGYRPPEGPFEGSSNYNSDYIKHDGAMRQSLKPQENTNLSAAPFDDTTGYNIDYGKKPLPPRECREKPQWSPSKVKFHGNTNYTDDFIPKATARVQAFKPDQTPQRADVPFHDATTQRTDFQAWQPEKPYVHVREAYLPPEGNFNGTTTHRLTFTPKAIELVKQARPVSTKREPGRFDDHTTYKGDFIKKAVPPQRVEKKSDYAPPDAPFQGNSSYTDNFIKHPGAVRSSLKPAENAVSTGAAFQGETMYHTDFYKKDVPPCPVTIISTGTSKYKFEEQDPSGHKWYQKMITPPLQNCHAVQLPVA